MALISKSTVIQDILLRRGKIDALSGLLSALNKQSLVCGQKVQATQLSLVFEPIAWYWGKAMLLLKKENGNISIAYYWCMGQTHQINYWIHTNGFNQYYRNSRIHVRWSRKWKKMGTGTQWRSMQEKEGGERWYKEHRGYLSKPHVIILFTST